MIGKINVAVGWIWYVNNAQNNTVDEMSIGHTTVFGYITLNVTLM